MKAFAIVIAAGMLLFALDALVLMLLSKSIYPIGYWQAFALSAAIYYVTQMIKRAP